LVKAIMSRYNNAYGVSNVEDRSWILFWNKLFKNE
jgi:hypothetical protein